jgi:hypothetical protein
MKSLIMTAILAAAITTTATGPAQASEDTTGGETPTAHEVCKVIGKWGENAMTGRQQGMAMSEQIEIANGMTVAFLRDSYISAIQDAYSQPRFSTDGHIQRAIQEHRDKYYLQCYKRQSKVQ